MPVFKNEANGTWYVMARYVNWKGERKQKCKRGFATKKEAQEWERMFQLQNASDLDMSFEAFTELYIRDVKNRLKENTWLTKEHIIRTKILPYFGKLRISEISTKEIITWQNELLAYRDEKKKPYSKTYLKTLHNQLSAMVDSFNPHLSANSFCVISDAILKFLIKKPTRLVNFSPILTAPYKCNEWCSMHENTRYKSYIYMDYNINSAKMKCF